MRKLVLFLLLLIAPVGAQEAQVHYPARQLEAAGRRWDYCYAQPAERSRPLPVVILLHGAGGSGGGYLARTRWGQVGPQRGYLVIAPSGIPLHPGKAVSFKDNPRVWNTGHWTEGERCQIADHEFFDKLLGDIAKNWTVDRQRVYLVGHSNGGTMALQLAERWPDRFAGVATVGTLPPEPTPRLGKFPRCLFVFGDEDQVVPLRGGPSQTPWGVRQLPAVKLRLDAWGAALGYQGEAPSWDELESDCKELRYGDRLRALVIGHQGHSWPDWQGDTIEMFGPLRPDFKTAETLLELLNGN